MTLPRGFTLLESILVVALLAALLVGGGILSAQYLRARHVRAAAEAVASELRAAQALAHAQVADSPHGVKAFPTHVIRFQGESYAGREEAADVRSDFAAPVALSGADEATFLSGSLFPAAEITITVQNDDLAEDITVSAYGLISITERTIGP